MVKRVVRYEVVIIDNRFRRRVQRFRGILDVLFKHFLGGNSISRSPLSQATHSMLNPFEDRIAVSRRSSRSRRRSTTRSWLRAPCSQARRPPESSSARRSRRAPARSCT